MTIPDYYKASHKFELLCNCSTHIVDAAKEIAETAPFIAKEGRDLKADETADMIALVDQIEREAKHLRELLNTRWARF